MSEVRLQATGIGSFFDEAAEAARRIDCGDLDEQPAEIAFESMDLLLKVLTPNRWRLLRALKGEGPTSIRQLSQKLQRDYRGVHTDVSALLDVGLVEKNTAGAICVRWDRIVAEMNLTEAA
ncbi:transcriptional regulator [Pseudorhizobium endolithicum]|uniref:Transcriptional regulator n=1 Tax=Pseudorhizobium endolithicum TaxID=1191678 RepID=A0ABN7JET0_9HYPH|nr:hypothetical protein [Pseudorhizobium endolithicum]CAD7027369.1 transcriptional regulator [Pseudorhizobium endolithicum]